MDLITGVGMMVKNTMLLLYARDTIIRIALIYIKYGKAKCIIN